MIKILLSQIIGGALGIIIGVLLIVIIGQWQFIHMCNKRIKEQDKMIDGEINRLNKDIADATTSLMYYWNGVDTQDIYFREDSEWLAPFERWIDKNEQ